MFVADWLAEALFLARVPAVFVEAQADRVALSTPKISSQSRPRRRGLVMDLLDTQYPAMFRVNSELATSSSYRHHNAR